MPYVGFLLSDPSPYLREFQRKPRKTLKDYVDKRDRGMSLAPLVYQFLNAATSGAKDGQLDIHALPGIRTWTFVVAASFPNHYTI